MCNEWSLIPQREVWSTHLFKGLIQTLEYSVGLRLACDYITHNFNYHKIWHNHATVSLEAYGISNPCMNCFVSAINKGAIIALKSMFHEANEL